ncbi:DUF1345 domain-containing protein [Agromyces sp. NPDC004153]
MSRSSPPPTLVRAIVAIIAGAIAAAATAPFLGYVAGFLVGWSVLALTSVVWVVVMVWPMDASRTREHARGEDPGRRLARLIALVGSLVGLGAVAVVLLQTRNRSEVEAFLLAGIAVVSVVSSWALVQVDYMLRIAARYYADPVGGIDFNQDEDPQYTDFVYFAVGLGMTYQVADTNVRTNEIRRIVIAQTLLAYLFGSVILASIINLVAGIV